MSREAEKEWVVIGLLPDLPKTYFVQTVLQEQTIRPSRISTSQKGVCANLTASSTRSLAFGSHRISPLLHPVLNDFSLRMTPPCPCEGFDISLRLADSGSEDSTPAFLQAFATMRAQTVLSTFSQIASSGPNAERLPANFKLLKCKGHPKNRGANRQPTASRGNGSRRGGKRGRGGPPGRSWTTGYDVEYGQ